MAFEYLSNVPLEETIEGFVAALKERGMAPRAESVPVGEALGRVTAEPLYAASMVAAAGCSMPAAKAVCTNVLI